MSLPRVLHHRLGYALDLLLLLAAWAATVVSVFMAHRDRWEWIIGTMIFVPLGTVAWLQLRLAARLFRLSERPHRAELATTLLSAREYLIRELKWPLLIALAPSYTTLFLHAQPFVMFWTDEMNASVWFASLLFYWHTCLVVFCAALSLAGTYYLLFRLCRSRERPFLFYLIPPCWAILTVALTLGEVYLLLLLFMDDVVNVRVVAGVGLLPTLATAGAVGFAWWQWRRACREYYIVE